MVIVMDMNTGRRIEDEFGAFEAEVLNAEWLPQPVLALGLSQAVPAAAPLPAASLDVDAFLRNVYLSQE